MQSSTHSSEQKKILVGVVILIAVIVIGWLAYRHFNPATTEAERRAAILNQIAADSAAGPQLSTQEKSTILKDISQTSATTTFKKQSQTSPPPLTADQKASIMQSLEI